MTGPEPRTVWALARRIGELPYEQWGVYEDGAEMAENVRTELEDELADDAEESEVASAQVQHMLDEIRPPAEDANTWYADDGTGDSEAYHAVRVGFAPKATTWQESHPAICCACGGTMLNASPEHMPIHVECYDLINEED